jgi:hypothetical protein
MFQGSAIEVRDKGVEGDPFTGVSKFDEKICNEEAYPEEMKWFTLTPVEPMNQCKGMIASNDRKAATVEQICAKGTYVYSKTR